MQKEFVHEDLGEEQRTISGSCRIIKEQLLDFDGRKVLYLLGVASVDSSCCGTGGCAYAAVPGFLVKMHARRNHDGKMISLVEPIDQEQLKKRIAAAIREKERVDQVNFI